jgi:hypothetical protein
MHIGMHLVSFGKSGVTFDIVDFILAKIEDVIFDGLTVA